MLMADHDLAKRVYRVFYRTWWSENPAWPHALEPCPGARRYEHGLFTEATARAYCKRRNAEPLSEQSQRLGIKWEFCRVPVTTD